MSTEFAKSELAKVRSELTEADWEDFRQKLLAAIESGALEACDTADDNDEACLSCEDTGWIVTPGGFKVPCSDCPTGELNFYHEREKTLAEMVHVDDGLGEEFEAELERGGH